MGEKKLTIGLLEDNPMLSELITTMLELAAGHTVTTYSDGASCLEHLFAQRGAIKEPLCDLLIVDLSLPGTLSGLDVISYICDTLRIHTLPIIVVSGAGQEQLARVRNRFPTIPTIQKPFQVQTLLNAIEECIALPARAMHC